MRSWMYSIWYKKKFAVTLVVTAVVIFIVDVCSISSRSNLRTPNTNFTNFTISPQLKLDLI